MRVVRFDPQSRLRRVLFSTFSAGWAAHEPDEPLEQFLERADQALYADKRSGKAAEQV